MGTSINYNGDYIGVHLETTCIAKLYDFWFANLLEIKKGNNRRNIQLVNVFIRNTSEMYDIAKKRTGIIRKKSPYL